MYNQKELTSRRKITSIEDEIETKNSEIMNNLAQERSRQLN